MRPKLFYAAYRWVAPPGKPSPVAAVSNDLCQVDDLPTPDPHRSVRIVVNHDGQTKNLMVQWKALSYSASN